MARQIRVCYLTMLLPLTLENTLELEHAPKPLTNDDVIAMVHKKLPESVIVSAIQAGPGKFNTSTNELIRLNAAGVTEKELNAMLAASGKASSSGAAAEALERVPIRMPLLCHLRNRGCRDWSLLRGTRLRN